MSLAKKSEKTSLIYFLGTFLLVTIPGCNRHHPNAEAMPLWSVSQPISLSSAMTSSRTTLKMWRSMTQCQAGQFRLTKYPPLKRPLRTPPPTPRRHIPGLWPYCSDFIYLHFHQLICTDVISMTPEYPSLSDI